MTCDPIYAETTVRVSVEFTDLDGNPADPTTVTLTVEDPDGADATPAVSNAGVGSYWAPYVPSLPGLYRYRWEGDGALVAATEGDFYARESGIT